MKIGDKAQLVDTNEKVIIIEINENNFKHQFVDRPSDQGIRLNRWDYLVEVEYDFEVKSDLTYRQISNLEKILNKKYFFGKGGFNIQVNENLFLSKERAENVSEEIHLLIIRQKMGESISEIEKLMLMLLTKSYSE